MAARTAPGQRNSAQARSSPMPAPGDLRLLQDLANTRDGASGQEKLGSPAEMADWLVSQGLIAADLELSAEDRQRVVELRDGLRLLLARRDRTQVGMKVIERINRAVKGAKLEIRLGPDGNPRADALSGTLDHAFGRWLSVIVNAFHEGEWIRLKVCANPACRIAFYDGSKSRARRWCTKRCGDRLRSRVYRRGARYKLFR